MKKSDLKSGMLVKTRNSKFAIVMLDTPKGDAIVGNGDDPHNMQTWFPLSTFDDDLTMATGGDGYDIVEVWGFSSNMRACSLSTVERELLWERGVRRVNLNREYTAEVNLKKKEVKVGCQTFSFSKIKELVEAMEGKN